MTISKKCIEKIAKLAALEPTEEKINAWVNDLANILEWANQLQAVNTENVKPMHSVISTLSDLESEFINNNIQDQVIKDVETIVREKWYTVPLRKDVCTESGDIRDEILKNAPLQKYGYFVVPKAIK